MSSQPQADPGWYLDPDNEHGLRFWNGEHWTEETKDIYPGAPITFAPEKTGADHQPSGAGPSDASENEQTEPFDLSRQSKNNSFQAKNMIVAVVLVISLLFLIPLSFILLASVKKTCREALWTTPNYCLATYSDDLSSEIDVFGVNGDSGLNPKAESLDGAISWQRVKGHPYGKTMILGADLVIDISVLTALFSALYLWKAVRIARDGRQENNSRRFWLVVILPVLTVASFIAVSVADSQGPKYSAIGASFATRPMSESEKETKRKLLNQERKQVDDVLNKIISLHQPGQRLLISDSPSVQMIMQCQGISNGDCRELLTLWKEEGVEIIKAAQDNYCDPYGQTNQCSDFEIFIRKPKSNQICIRRFSVYSRPVFSNKTILRREEECLGGSRTSYEEMRLSPYLHGADQKPLNY